jgi:hypothetical protein
MGNTHTHMNIISSFRFSYKVGVTIPWFGQDQRLPTPRCGVPTDEGCNQPLSSGPKTNLNTTVFCFDFQYPVCEESPQLGVSHPYT